MPLHEHLDMTTLALIGQPNCGKSTLFNRLTGARQKVANYAGATVEKRTGVWQLPDHLDIHLIDLPGLYELSGAGIEEWIAASTVLNLRDDGATVDGAIVVVDVTALERGLVLVGEVLALGVPAILAINMIDIAAVEGVFIDRKKLESELGIPVVEISARRDLGIDSLAAAVRLAFASPSLARNDAAIAAFLSASATRRPDLVLPLLKQPVENGADRWLPLQGGIVARAEALAAAAIRREGQAKHRGFSRRLDDWLVHPVWGLGIFLLLMLGIFQSVYAWSDPLIGMIEDGIAALGDLLAGPLGGSFLGDLFLDAGLYGAGNVVVFLPQILILFLWIAILEESGYLARVAFMVDRPMRAAGLSGKSFIPLLSSYACAVPGIMAARVIEHQPTRLLTIFVAPLMTCSARLPVYALLIGVFVPDRTVLGIFNVQGIVLFSLYAAGVLGALGLAKLISRRIDRGIPIPIILELPIYRWPDVRNVLLTLKDRAWIFIRRAGTVIFGMSIVLWLLLSFPQYESAEADILAKGGTEEDVSAYRIQHSAGGRLGAIIEPVIQPLGYDWKIGLSLIASFAAREVMVATLGTIYNLGEVDEASIGLRDALRADPAWDLATALSLLVFYVFALQCMSTVAIMKKETGGWRWPLAALASTYGLGYVLALATYQIASRLL